MVFKLGIHDLDKEYPDMLKPGCLVSISGPPGSGKTTLASTICHANLKENKRCLYISFFEDKTKYYENMARLGLDFSTYEKRGTFMHLRIPIVRSIRESMDVINSIIEEFGPDIVVFDSVNALMQYVEKEDRRAFFHNLLVLMPKIINGVIVLVAEKTEKTSVPEVDYASDLTIELKYMIERGFLTRYMYIEKARGMPLKMAEFPFTIHGKSGIRVFVPETPRTITVKPRLYYGETTLTKKYLEPIMAGSSLLIVYPPDARAVEWVFTIFELAFVNDLVILSLSYTYSPQEQNVLLKRAYSQYFNIGEEIVEKAFKKHLRTAALNPYAYSINELFFQTEKIIEENNPDVVVFHGKDVMQPIIESEPTRFYQLLANQRYNLKKKGIFVVEAMSCISEIECRRMASLSDIVIRVLRPMKPGGVPSIYIWRRARAPQVIPFSKELADTLRDQFRNLVLRKFGGEEN